MSDTRVIDRMVPFFFGPPNECLYGCHHLPCGTGYSQYGVVLCYPLGYEYIRAHRAFYQLAVRFAALGFHVLRFDYFGCGDSGGAFEEGTIEKWVGNVHASIGELQAKSGVTRIFLVGLRFGATLALLASGECRCIDGLVLWEPIVDGKAYIAQLTEEHVQFARQHIPKARKPFAKSIAEDEVIGLPMNLQIRQEIGSVKIERPYVNPEIKKVLILLNDGGMKNQCPLDWGSLEPDFYILPDSKTRANETYKRIIPSNAIKSIADWVERLSR